MPVHPKYRPDIDGLRAIAIILVVLFHAFPDVVKGGFIGVDVFFVISGFLISTIIVGGLENNTFSFVDFYVRRIKRIFPGVLLVLAVCFIFGWFELLASEFQQLCKHIAGGAGFIANIILWTENGYFDNAAETKPLQHLWSLGVEEQFYFIWPLLMWVASKRRFNLLGIAVAVGVVSFWLNIREIHRDVIAAFYLPQTRFWELMVGSILAYLLQHKTGFNHKFGKLFYAPSPDGQAQPVHHLRSLAGIALILCGTLVINKSHSFPGWWATLPTLGAALIIAAGPQAWLNRHILSSRVLVWFGLISFPLYLWHWPLLSFAHILYYDALQNEICAGIILLSILLAWLTYKLVENPLRFGGHSKAKAAVLFVLMVIIGGIGYAGYKQEGFKYRVLGGRQEYLDSFRLERGPDGPFKDISKLDAYRDDCNFYVIPKEGDPGSPIPHESIDKSCYQKDPAFHKTLFLWGDSHVQQFYFGLKKHLPPDWQILIVGTSGCNPDINVPGPSKENFCKQGNWFAVDQIKKTKPDIVLIAQRKDHDVKTMNDIAAKLQDIGVKKIVFAGPVPQWKTTLPKVIVTRLWPETPKRTFVGLDKSIMTANESLKENFKPSAGVVFVDLINFFCDKSGCMTYVGDDKMTGTVAWDYGHLTPLSSEYLAKEFLLKALFDEGLSAQTK